MKEQKNNTTALVLGLVAIMLASGLIIPQAYMRYMNNLDFRPPFEKGLTKNIRILDDLRGITSLDEFGGHLWVAYCTSTQEGNENLVIQQKVKALRARFPQETIKAALFVVDASITEPEKLAAYRAKHSEVLTDHDYVIAGNAEVLQKYLRNEFRFDGVPYEKEGAWIYDHDVIVLDRIPADENGNRPTLAHMRGHINFVDAIQRDQDGIKTNAKYVRAEEDANKLLVNTITYLIENPNEEDQHLSGQQQ